MMYPPMNPIYEMRDQEWTDLHKAYWDYHIPCNVPTQEHVQFFVQQILTAGSDVTRAMRYKNECVIMSRGDEQQMINEGWPNASLINFSAGLRSPHQRTSQCGEPFIRFCITAQFRLWDT